MNKIFKVIYNKALGVFMAVSELSQNKGKRSEKNNNPVLIQMDGDQRIIKNKLFNLSLISSVILLTFLPIDVMAGRGIFVQDGRVGTDPDSGGSNRRTININPQSDSSDTTNGRANGTVSEGGVAIGYAATARGRFSTAVGYNARADGDTSIAYGANATVTASHGRGIAIGNGANVNTRFNANATDGIAIGTQSYASADGSIGIGRNTNSASNYSIWIGSKTNATTSQNQSPGWASIWIGAQTNNTAISGTSNNDADVVAIGRDAYAKQGSAQSVVIGSTATTGRDGLQATAVGFNTNAGGRQATTVGANAGASGQSIALGADVYASGLSSLALGSDDLVSNNVGSVDNTAKNKYGLELPENKIKEIFKQLYSPTGGVPKFFNNEEAFLQKYSNRNGNKYAVFSPTYAGGRGAIAIGARAVASADTSTALGALSFAFSSGSTALGFLSYVDSNSEGGTAVGRNARVFAENALAVGNQTEATGVATLAYGYKAKAVGEGALAIGNSVAANAAFDRTISARLVTDYKELNDQRADFSRGVVDTNSASGSFKTFNEHFNTVFMNSGSDNRNSSGLPLQLQNDTVFTIGNQTIKKIVPQPDAKNAIVLGNRSFAVKNNSIALGYATLSDADNAFAFGSYSYVNSKANNSIAFGVGAYVGIDDVSPQPNSGNYERLDLSNSLALGTFSSVRSKNSVAVGPFSNVGGNSNLGYGNNTAVGYLASVTSNVTDAVSLGSSSTTSASRSVAIGNSAQASLENSVALGYRSTTRYHYVDNSNGGNNSNRTPTYSDLGGNVKDANTLQGYIPAGTTYNLQATENAGVISVGGWNEGADSVGLRRIINVAAGALDSDAATVGQLRALEYTKKESNLVYYALIGGQYVRVGYKDSDGKYYPIDTANGSLLTGTGINREQVFAGPKNLATGTKTTLSGYRSADGRGSAQVATVGDPLPFGNISKVIVSTTTNGNGNGATAQLTPTDLSLGTANNPSARLTTENLRFSSTASGNKARTATFGNDGVTLDFGGSNTVKVDKTGFHTPNSSLVDNKLTVGAGNGTHVEVGTNSITGFSNASNKTAGLQFGNNTVTLVGQSGQVTLSNVKAGSAGTDAVNVSQLKGLGNSIKTLLGNNFTVGNGGLTVAAPSGGIGGTGKTTVNEAIQWLRENAGGKIYYKVNSQPDGKGTQTETFNFVANTNTGENGNIQLTDVHDGTVKIALNTTLTGLTSVGLTGNGDSATLTSENLKFTKDSKTATFGNDGVTLDFGSNNTVKVDKTGFHTPNSSLVDNKLTVGASNAAHVEVGTNSITGFSNASNKTAGLQFSDNTVSLVGRSGDVTLSNVKAGSNNTDAVNVSQLKGLGNSIKNLLGNNFGGDGSTVTAPNSGGIGGTGKTTVNEAIQWLRENAGGKIYYKVNSQPSDKGTQTETFNFVANTNTGGDGNIQLTDVHDGTVKIALNTTLTGLTSVGLGSGNQAATLTSENLKFTKDSKTATYGNDGVTLDLGSGNNVKVSKDGFSVKNDNGESHLDGGKLTVGGSNEAHVEVGTNGITGFSNGSNKTAGLQFSDNTVTLVGKNGEVTLSNVKKGNADTDAVNVKQLYDATTSLQKVLGNDIAVANDNGTVTFKASNGDDSGNGIGGTNKNTISEAIKAVLDKVDQNATKAKFGYKANPDGHLYTTTLKQGLTFNNTDNNIKISTDTESKGQLYFDLNKAITGLTSVGLSGSGGESATLTSENLQFTKDSKTATFGNDGVTLDLGGGNTVKVDKEGFHTPKSSLVDGKLTVGGSNEAHVEVGTDGITGFSNGSDKTAGLKFEENKVTLVGKVDSSPIKLTGVDKGVVANNSSDAINGTQLYNVLDKLRAQLGLGDNQLNPDTDKATEKTTSNGGNEKPFGTIETAGGTITTGSGKGTNPSGGGGSGSGSSQPTIGESLKDISAVISKGYTFTTKDKTSDPLYLGASLYVNGDENIGVDYTREEKGAKGTYTVTLNKTLTGLTSVGLGSGNQTATLTSENLKFTKDSKTATFGNDGVTLDLGSGNNVKVSKDGFSVKNEKGESHLDGGKLTVGASNAAHVEVANNGITGFTNASNKTSGVKFDNDKISLVDNQGKDGSSGNSSQGVTLTNLKKGNLTGKTSTDATTVGQLYDLAETVLGIQPTTGSSDFTKPTFTGSTLNTNGNNGKHTFKDAIQTIANSLDKGYTFAGDNGSKALPLSGTLNIKSGDLTANSVNYKGLNLYTEYKSDNGNTGTLYIGLSDTPTFSTVTATSQLKVGNGTGVTDGATLTAENLKFTKDSKTATYSNDGVTLDFGSGHTVKVDKTGFHTPKASLIDDKLTVGGSNEAHVEVGNNGITGFSNASDKTAGLQFEENKISLVGKNGEVTLSNVKAGSANTDAVNVKQLYDATTSLQSVLGKDITVANNNGAVTFSASNGNGSGNGIGGTKANTISDAIKAVLDKVDKNATEANFGYRANANGHLYTTTLQQGLTFNTNDNNIKISTDTNNKGQLYFDLNKTITGLTSVGLSGSGGESATLTSENLQFTKDSKTATFGNDGVTLDLGGGNTVKVDKEGFHTPKSSLVDGKLTVGGSIEKHVEVGTDSITGFSNGSDKTAGLKFEENKVTLVGKENSSPIKLTGVDKGLVANNSSDAINGTQLYNVIDKLREQLGLTDNQLNPDSDRSIDK
ncbi:hypothetical protein CEP49_04065 [Mergibacter septicus]|uniref:ESPR-type extended signal peptide-containing protein n=1 Tax=Mergibacter septicus TaxID=221402 RepID=UPI00117945A9|nr:ESPR-type extended signal peptide-containing protein [Mergibacter septicus]AWX14622.1 hypothetical protein CEP49_04065 [Mergibacter septicus]